MATEMTILFCLVQHVRMTTLLQLHLYLCSLVRPQTLSLLLLRVLRVWEQD